MEKNQNGEDIPDKTEFVKNIGLSGTVELARNSVQGKQYIYDLTYATAAWIKIAEVTMGVPSTININLIGGSGYNVGFFGQCAITNIVLRTGNNNPHGVNAVMYTTNSGAPTDLESIPIGLYSRQLNYKPNEAWLHNFQPVFPNGPESDEND
ncbi:hypothetical protein XBJ1_2762 [Xenorhabdus bovienii SS-2004]|uniref:Uncharacterized protein n=1 Tax=Xenorhabdus bovienii (strain SS-2004) TaxID=406818 RepID=D3V7S4_XENBS|nr:hypothetical protein XBJ1_2762 [Xenorhabdus bovienii SS-2004]